MISNSEFCSPLIFSINFLFPEANTLALIENWILNKSYFEMHGMSQIFWPLPNSSPSLSDCGKARSNVSGRNRHSPPPAIPMIPRTNSGNAGETTCR